MGITGKRHCKIWSLLSRTLTRSFPPSSDEARYTLQGVEKKVADSNFNADPAKAALGERHPLSAEVVRREWDFS